MDNKLAVTGCVAVTKEGGGEMSIVFYLPLQRKVL